ncbi:MAG: hypothetical protein ACTSYL_10975 [Candidatus Thorarchaeota archaeon]
MMYAEIVTLTVMLGCLLCIIHSWLYRNHWETIAFFVGGFVFGIVRENIVALMPQLYVYPNHPLYIGAAPLMMGFGWSASFYACWIISERLVEAFAPSLGQRWWGIPLVAAINTGILSIPVEVAAGAPQTQWWIWPANAATILWEMPVIVPFGWAGAAFLFIIFFQKIMRREDTPEKKTLLFILATLLIIIIHLVYVLVVRTIVVLLTGI